MSKITFPVSRSYMLAFGLACTSLVGCTDGDKDKDAVIDTSDTLIITDSGDTDPNDLDADGDGVPATDDCDDGNASVYPGADELCDGLDNDCDGEVDEGAVGTYYADADGDGFGDENESIESCEPGSGYVSNSGDCNDDDARYYPGAPEEDCTDPNDYNCDGSTGYADVDGDGYAACVECDDTDAAINPGAAEVCDGVDNDCDGSIDEDVADSSVWYADADGDGFGDPGTAVTACDAPAGYVSNSDDCDDSDANVNPRAVERCNGIDDDCDGTIDGSGAVDASVWYADADGDSYGDPGAGVRDCEEPTGYTSDSSDCDDGAASVHPGADEYCNSVDDDCDGTTDEDAIDGGWYYTDADGDGFGEAGTLAMACSGADNELDCNDSDALEPIVVDIATGSASGAGTMASPFDSIQTGIDASSECVVVYAGTYNENIDFGGNNVSVTSVDGAESTIIDGSGGSGAVVSFESGETSDATLSGFTLTGGAGHYESWSETTGCSSSGSCTAEHESYCGGGVYVASSSPTLDSLIIESNTLPAYSASYPSDTVAYFTHSYGGGVCVVDGSPMLTGADLISNYADQGGGMYLDETSVVTYTQGWIIMNTASDGAGFQIDAGSLTLSNAASAWNVATDNGGGVLNIDGSLDATNVTWGEDDAMNGGGLYLYVDAGAPSATVRNSIIYGADSGEGVFSDVGGSYNGSYSDVYGNAAGNYSGVTDPTGTGGNISVDPLFTSVTDDGDYTNDLWTLLSGSPAVNAGNPSASFNDTDGTRNDMGAWGGPNGSW